MIGTRRVVLIPRLRRVVTGELLDIKKFVNGSRHTNVAGVNTIFAGGGGKKSTSAAGDGNRFMSVVGVGENSIFVAGDGVSSMSAVGAGENFMFAGGDGGRSMSADGGKLMFADGPIVAISGGVTGVTTVGGITVMNAGGNRFMFTSAGGKLVTYTNAGGSCGTSMNVGGNCDTCTSAGGNKFMSMNAGGKLSMFTSVGGKNAMNVGGNLFKTVGMNQSTGGSTMIARRATTASGHRSV